MKTLNARTHEAVSDGIESRLRFILDISKFARPAAAVVASGASIIAHRWHRDNAGCRAVGVVVADPKLRRSRNTIW